MRISLANPKVKFFIGDVRNSDSLLPAMQDVDYVFHAAAAFEKGIIKEIAK